MAWLKFDTATPEKPEVLQITMAMGWDDPDLTVGKLLKLWRWFDVHTVDGNAAGVSAALLDRLIGVTGFAKAVADAGWLIIHESGLTLPNFCRHNGKTAKDRVLTAQRVASHKDSKKGNASIVTSALPREEKRREEVNLTTANAVVVPSPAEAEPETPDDGKFLPCPHDKVIALYHEALPVLPRIREWTAARQQTLRSRWRAKCAELHWSSEADGIAWFSRFFAYVSESEFLCGRSQPPPGRTPFVADLEWLLKPANFTKVVEGKYHA